MNFDQFCTSLVILEECLCVYLCLSVSLYVSVFLCLDRAARVVSRRSVMPGWTVARLLSSIPTHRSRHRRRRLTPALAASAAGDVIDDGDAEMIDDNATYFSVPLDIKPPGWILTSVCY